MVSWFLLMVQLLPVLRFAVGLEFSKPNCVNQCGDVNIPYPFGIGADCFYDQSYEITCNTSSGSPKPFLHQFNLEVLNIDWPGRDSQQLHQDPEQSYTHDGQILTVGLPRQNLCESTGNKKIISYDFKSSPYWFSTEDNSLMIEGCGISAAIKTRYVKILTRCASMCVGDIFNKTGTTCDGIGCCTASVPNDYEDFDLDFYEIDVAFEQLADSISCNASVAFINTNSMEIIPDHYLVWQPSLRHYNGSLQFCLHRVMKATDAVVSFLMKETPTFPTDAKVDTNLVSIPVSFCNVDFLWSQDAPFCVFGRICVTGIQLITHASLYIGVTWCKNVRAAKPIAFPATSSVMEIVTIFARSIYCSGELLFLF